MELCLESLRKWLNRRNQEALPCVDMRIYRWLAMLCEGVQYIHENDMIHRDIKPENLLLDHAGTLKICDLGNVKLRASSATTRTPNVGTLLYQAPEQQSGKYDNRIDVYPIGIMIIF